MGNAWAFVFTFLAVRAEVGEVADHSRTLIRKCCPLDQQLNALLDVCESRPRPGEMERGTEPETEEESVAELLQRYPGGFPPWMRNDTPIYDQTSGQLRAQLGLLESSEAEAGLRVRYGPAPPCVRSQAKVVVVAASSKTSSQQRFRLRSDGVLLLRTASQAPGQIPRVHLLPDEYCADRVSSPTADKDVFIFLTCPCRKTLCINKCCNRRQFLLLTGGQETRQFSTCADVAHASGEATAAPWAPHFANESQATDHVVLDANVPTCGPGSAAVLLNAHTESTQTMRVLANGSVLLEGFGGATAFPSSSWCGDWSQQLPTDAGDSKSARVENAIFCHATSIVSSGSLLYGALFAVSAVFLALTLCVYALLPALRRSSHAKALLCHVAALLGASVALAVGQLRTFVPDGECYAQGFIIQYMMLATFCWLNVLSFDIGCSLRWGECSATRSERRTFLCYSLFAWGVPAAFSAVTLTLQFAGDYLPTALLRPDIGLYNCWFHDQSGAWAFFYGPLAALLVANAALWAGTAALLVTAWRRRRRQQCEGVGDGARSSGGGGRRRMVLLRAAGTSIALFLFSGASWLTEVASFAEGSDSVVWTAFDVINILRGLFIFLLLCCRPKVVRLLRKRLLRGRAEATSGGGDGIGGGSGDGSSGGSEGSSSSALQMSTVRTDRAPHRP